MRIHHALAALFAISPFASAQVQQQLRIGENLNGFGANLSNGVQFGADVAAIGDLDGDGENDLAVSMPRDNDGGPSTGAVWILFLEDDGTVKSYQKISPTQGGFNTALGAGAYFGSAVAALSDINGDGVRDLAVGADGDSQAGFRRGAVWILFLNTNGTVKSKTLIASGVSGFNTVLENSDRFGSALVQVGDIDDDGRVELAVGALGDDDGVIDGGAVYLLSLNTNGTVFHESKISATSGGFTATFADGDEFGGGLGALGDFDTDGVEDLAVGMIKFKTGSALTDDDSGAVHVLFLNADGTVETSKRISKGSSGFTPTTQTNNALFGSAIVLGDDHDGDGIRDLFVGSPSWRLSDAIITGSTWLIYMKADGTAKDNTQVGPGSSGFVGPLFSGDYFGCGLAPLDDYDGNGFADLAVGSLGADLGALDAGSIWFLSLSNGGKTAFAKRTAVGNNDAMNLVTTTAGSTVSTPPRLGGLSRLVIDCSKGAGHNQGVFFAFDGKVTIPILGTYTLLCIDSGMGIGELLTGSGQIVNEQANNRMATFPLAIPNNAALQGFQFSAQGLLRDSTLVNKLEVTQAWDITIGL